LPIMVASRLWPTLPVKLACSSNLGENLHG
jgi:hypothetical protein